MNSINISDRDCKRDLFQPRILVVIPTLNEEKTIEQVLRDLKNDLPSGFLVIFIVVDGGSTDRTVEIVQRLLREDSNIRLIKNPKRRQGAGVNLAIMEFAQDNEIFIRCDAHMTYPPGFIRNILNSISRIGSESIVISMDSVGKTCLQKGIAWISDTFVGSGGSAHRGGRKSGFVDHGHHAAFRVSAFRNVGGYDETFTHNEDAELDCRQIANGHKIFLDANIRVQYYPRDDYLGLWRQYFNYGRGRARTVKKHPHTLRLRQFAVPVNFIILCIAFICIGYSPMSILWPISYVSALILASGICAFQHKSFCGLLGVPAAIIMHTSWSLGFLVGLI